MILYMFVTVVLISRGKINAREYVESLPISTIVSTVLSKKAAITRLCNVCKSDVNRANTLPADIEPLSHHVLVLLVQGLMRHQ
jgi:hypothetical protein